MSKAIREVPTSPRSKLSKMFVMLVVCDQCGKSEQQTKCGHVASSDWYRFWPRFHTNLVQEWGLGRGPNVTDLCETCERMPLGTRGMMQRQDSAVVGTERTMAGGGA